MQAWKYFILIFSGLGIFNSLAFIFYITFFERSGKDKSVFLQILLLAFILQISYALSELFVLNNYPYLSNLYLIGAYIQGPAIYFYLRKSLKPGLNIWPKLFTVHILPYLIISSLKYDFAQPGFREWFAIYLVGIQYLFYIILNLKPYFKVRKEYKKNLKEHFVIVYLYPVHALLWLYYPFSAFTKTNYQIWETVLHAFFIYYMIFLLLKAPKTAKDKYRFSDINEEESERIYRDMVQKIEENELYLDPNLTLAKLARKMNLPLNTLSQVINQNSHSNFRDFINAFRIRQAKEFMLTNLEKNYTISGIAYDCGFNSLSAFNRAFKKINNTTPSEFIKLKISRGQ